MTASTDTRDPARALPTIEEIATKEHLPLEVIESLYQAELERLRKGARVVDFLPLLASRGLQRQLRHRQGRFSEGHKLFKES